MGHNFKQIQLHYKITKCFHFVLKVILNSNDLKLTYRRFPFKNSYKGEYFTNYHKLYLNDKIIGNLYGNEIYDCKKIKDLVMDNIIFVFKLRKKEI